GAHPMRLPPTGRGAGAAGRRLRRGCWTPRGCRGTAAARLHRRHVHARGPGHGRRGERGGVPRAGGRAVGGRRRRAARVPALRRGGHGARVGGPLGIGAGADPGRRGGRVLPLRGRQAAGRGRGRRLRGLHGGPAGRGAGAERRRGRAARGAGRAAGDARLLRRPCAGQAHPGGGGPAGRQVDGAAPALRVPRVRALGLLLRRGDRGQPPGSADGHPVRGDRLGAARLRRLLPRAGRRVARPLRHAPRRTRRPHGQRRGDPAGCHDRRARRPARPQGAGRRLGGLGGRGAAGGPAGVGGGGFGLRPRRAGRRGVLPPDGGERRGGGARLRRGRAGPAVAARPDGRRPSRGRDRPRRHIAARRRV
ncbi:MAG: hypothetical protein AVDCRST_MAG04-2755, partial [uncultured Acetobacteraceae bacterium]